MLFPCRYCLDSNGQTLVSCGAPAAAPSVAVATTAVTGSWTDQLTAWAGQFASPVTLQLAGSNVTLCSTGLGAGNAELSAVSGLCDDGFVCAPLAAAQMPDTVQANLNGEHGRAPHIRRLVLLTSHLRCLEVQAKEAQAQVAPNLAHAFSLSLLCLRPYLLWLLSAAAQTAAPLRCAFCTEACRWPTCSVTQAHPLQAL